MYFDTIIWDKIYEYDYTYRDQFNKVVREINLRYDGGLWWIKKTGLLVKQSPEISRFWCKRNDLVELNFLTRENDISIILGYFHLKDVLNELTCKSNIKYSCGCCSVKKAVLNK